MVSSSLLAGRADVSATNRTNVPESGANGDASLSVRTCVSGPALAGSWRRRDGGERYRLGECGRSAVFASGSTDEPR
jgi:hypothetical protein